MLYSKEPKLAEISDRKPTLLFKEKGIQSNLPSARCINHLSHFCLSNLNKFQCSLINFHYVMFLIYDQKDLRTRKFYEL